jgi:hypothetical protein
MRLQERSPGDAPGGTPLQILHSLVPNATGGPILTRLATASINHRGREKHEVDAELTTEFNRVRDAAISLFWLHSQAELALQRLSVQMGRGGSRNRATPKGSLIRETLNIYSHMRKRFPGSGSKPGFGEPMLRFIRAVADLASLTLSNREIEQVWRVRDSSRK